MRVLLTIGAACVLCQAGAAVFMVSVTDDSGFGTLRQANSKTQNNQAAAAGMAGVADLAAYPVYAHPGPDVAGQTVAFDIVVTNRGPDTAHECWLDAGPAWAVPPFLGEGLTVSNGWGSVSGKGSYFSCDLGNLAPFQSASVRIQFLLTEAGDYYQLLCSVRAKESDPNAADNTIYTQRLAEAGAGVLSFLTWPFAGARPGDDFVPVLVQRLGGAQGLVSAAYRTRDGTAQANLDYLPIRGTLVFTNGQDQATVYIPLIERSSAPERRWFSLSLEEPTGGAVLASQTNVTVDLANSSSATTVGEVVGVSVVDTNLTPPGNMANQNSYSPLVSADGRYICFNSNATNLVPPGLAAFPGSVYRRDLWSNTTELVNVNAAGIRSGRGSSFLSSITPDGRFVCFISDAADLVAGTTNWGDSVFVRDMERKLTCLTSVSAFDPTRGVGGSGGGIISEDGRLVVFSSLSGELVTNDANDSWDLFVRDLETETTLLVSASTNGGSYPRIFDRYASPFGIVSNRYVFFESNVDALVAHDTNGPGCYDLFVRDLWTGTTRLINATPAGTSPSKGWTFARSVSADGHFVVMHSDAADLLPGDHNNQFDVFVRDLWLDRTLLVSANTNGTFGDGHAHFPSMSADGRFIVFESTSTDLVTNDVNGALGDVFIRDMVTGLTRLISIDLYGEGSGQCPAEYPIISANGRAVGFRSVKATWATGYQGTLLPELFLRDLDTEVTTLVTRTLAGWDSNFSESSWFGGLSADGRVACFESTAPDLVAGDQPPDIWEGFGCDVFAWKATAPSNLVDLRLLLSAATNLVSLADGVTLTAVITNAGLNTAPGVRLTTVTPADWTWTSQPTNQGTWSNNGWHILCDLGDLPPGAVVTVSWGGQPARPGPFTIESSVISTVAPEHTPNNNRARITLFIADAGTDADGDGLSDEWEWRQGFDPLRGIESWDDSDKDRLPNLFEFLAGTDPHDPESNIRILEARVDVNEVWVRFTTVAGRHYALERNAGFASDTWLTIAAGLPGTGEPITARDTEPGVSSSRVLYRVRLEE